MNKKLLSSLAVAAVMLLAGCNNTAAHEPTSTPNADNTTPAQTETSDLPEVIETDGADDTGRVTAEDKIKGLEKDTYDGLTISAEILQRNAIVPGMTVPVTILVKNTGDKTVRYTHGSGSMETPDALMVEVNGLQTIISEDRLGPATMDLQTKELKAGEELKFVVNVMVIEPNANFDNYTYEIHGKDKTYIGSIDLPNLKETYADLKEAATGTYDGKAYFTYSVVEDAATPDATSNANIFSGDTSYAEADFKIAVTD